MNLQPLQIAIDGPVASGKGEIAARLARKLDLLYIYTGAMYRALALLCLRTGTSLHDEKYVRELLEKHSIEVLPPNAESTYPYAILLDGEDVTDKMLDQEVAQGSSDVGVFSSVRQWMVSRQKELAKDKRVVMEGRDISLRVLPQAQLKVYLTASLEARASRRAAQRLSKGIATSVPATLSEIKERDVQDMTRTIDPLQKVVDAWELDTTHMTIDEVVDAICVELRNRNLL